ncbi:exoribonuclease II [Spirochaetia bacterium]|nr:exoribonuclease II [Spirochaetia bacterium]
MIRTKSLVIYKTHPALVTEEALSGEKIGIALPGGEKLKVREKDIEPLYTDPIKDTADYPGILEQEEADVGDVQGAWELLKETSLPETTVPLKELAELAYGEYTPKTAWAAYGLLRDGLYFSGTIGAIRPRAAADVAADEQKRAGKQREMMERGAFLQRLRANRLVLPADAHFLQDAEALAYGKTEKSRTLKELGLSETPLDAHRLLLNAGFWTPLINPHPTRFGLTLNSAQILPEPTPAEDRQDLTHLHAFAIDNAWSADPDDAVSIEDNTLYVHVADPAASILPGNPADVEARNRGSTLYLPEGTYRMIAEAALPLYALGLSDVSPALTFKMALNEDGSIKKTDIFPSFVRVTRLTYEEADAIVAGDGAAAIASPYGPELHALFRLGERNLTRRLDAGAIAIDLPEVHITARPESVSAADRSVAAIAAAVSIEPSAPCKSADMVRECMLLAGEGAAQWALQHRLPFPYITQETGDLPEEPLPGMAGSYQLRRCMRPRSLSVKPGLHWGLGLDIYTQVTSPLRRYTDLLAHQQIRAFLRNTGDKPLSEEEVLVRLVAGEAAAQAAVHGERASRAHWTAVYLSDKIGSVWDGIALDRKGGRAVVMIPALGIETQAAVKNAPEPNEPLWLTLTSVKIPEAEGVFVIE